MNVTDLAWSKEPVPGKHMSFIASCPFCRRRVQAPERALGRSIACKRCHNHFTLAPDDEAELHQVAAPSSSELEINFQSMPPTVTPSKRRGRGSSESEGTTPSSETVPQLKPLTTPALPVLRDEPPPLEQPERWNWHTIGVLAMFLGSLALGCASLEWLQWLTIPLSALGLIAGAFGLMVDYTEKTEEWTPKIGAILSGCVLLVALAWPAFLGLDPKLTSELPPPVDPNRQVFLPRERPAGPRQPAQPVPENHWVAAELYDIDHGVVRLRVLNAGVHDVPGNRKGRREKEYVVTLLLSHAGTRDAVTFSGWHGAVPRLLDSSGKPLAFRPRGDAGQAPLKSIVPFRPIQETLAFDAPSGASDYVRLELPASAFGAAGMVRFQIPRLMTQAKQ
jgi:hypothetical protein